VTILAEKLRRRDQRARSRTGPNSHQEQVRSLLSAALSRARQAVERQRYREVIRLLSPLLQQRAWWQLDDPNERAAYRSTIVELLSLAYDRLRKPQQASALRTDFLQQEAQLEEALSQTIPPP
ncbi:MAG: hypothetical protein NZ473_04670, partial [Candidatus Kapabacteria bacterium]|nr:hypothetical protein [Candidatus Kapabacteria bacterium]MDW8224505.1 hypothetical protein [Bacteroidota bacterium]